MDAMFNAMTRNGRHWAILLICATAIDCYAYGRFFHDATLVQRRFHGFFAEAEAGGRNVSGTGLVRAVAHEAQVVQFSLWIHVLILAVLAARTRCTSKLNLPKYATLSLGLMLCIASGVEFLTVAITGHFAQRSPILPCSVAVIVTTLWWIRSEPRDSPRLLLLFLPAAFGLFVHVITQEIVYAVGSAVFFSP